MTTLEHLHKQGRIGVVKPKLSRRTPNRSAYAPCSAKIRINVDYLRWAHVFAIYLLTVVCLLFLRREFRAYIMLRQKYLQQRKAHMKTIMLDVPTDARSNAILASYFSYMYPGCVLSAVCTQVRKKLGGENSVNRSRGRVSRIGPRDVF